MTTGDDLAAAKLIHPGPRYPEFMRMWANLAAIHAGNATALEALEKDSASLGTDDTISLLRALATNQQLERLIAAIELCRTRFDLPKWYVKRLQAELLVDMLPVSSGARDLLVELSTSEDIPSQHLAEVWYNIGVIESQRGDHDAAQAARQRAVELNPELDVAHGP
jgi:tetratricopeptide (TPR) repeat protein